MTTTHKPNKTRTHKPRLDFDAVPIQCGFRSSRGVYYRKMDHQTAICLKGKFAGKLGIFRHPKTGRPDYIQSMGTQVRWDYAVNVAPGSRVADLTTMWDITHNPEELPPLTPVVHLTKQKRKEHRHD